MFAQYRPASVVKVTPTLVDSTNTVTPGCSVAVALGDITEWGWVTKISMVWSLHLWVVIVVVVVGDVVPRDHILRQSDFVSVGEQLWYEMAACLPPQALPS